MRASRRTGIGSILALVTVSSLLGCLIARPPSPAGGLLLTKSQLDFGSVATGSSKTVLETVSNPGASALTISQISSTGAGFGFSGITPPVTLSAGQSFTFSVSFTPQSSGSVNGALSISSNASNASLSVGLTGMGSAQGQLAITPSSINFGNAVVGARQSRTATLSAANASVTVSSAGTNSSELSLTGISFPLTIAAGHTASFTVTFTPQASGTASANITFASNASNSSTVLATTGTGIPASQHSVTLAWNASTSSNVVGYNVYRGTQSGGPYAKLTSFPEPGTSFMDGTVQSGATYFYVATSVDSSSVESPYSSPAMAVIPTP